jgi:exosome complex component RRP4
VLEVNDVILLKVNDVNEIKDISVELISKLFKGTILEINPKKVARVIGKSQSMLLTIEKYTKTKVTVGANGYLYVIGENIKLVQETLEKIDEYSHVDNLTNKIEEFLQKVTN